MKKVFIPNREFALMSAVTLAFPALISLILVIRGGWEVNIGATWIIWVFCIVGCAITAVTSYCVLEIDDTALHIRYPFRFLIGNYSYSLSIIDSVNLGEWSFTARMNYITVHFKKGHELEGFLGPRNSVRHGQMFLRKSRRKIVEEFARVGIPAYE